MKHIRILLLGLVFALLLPLAGCAKDSTPPVMTYKNTEITEAMYTYWTATYKTYFLQVMGGEDTEECLATEVEFQTEEGPVVKTIGAYISDRIDEILRSNCIGLYLFDSYGLSLPDMTKNAVDTAIASEIENAGGRKALNVKLAEIGLNVDLLREMYLADEKINYVYDYLYGNTTLGTQGAEPISLEKYTTYYEENYACVKHIYIRTADKNVTDEEGNVQYDASGNVVTAALTEEEAAAKLALCDDIQAQLEKGADFDELIETYSEDAGRTVYKDGYIVCAATALPDVFLNNAFAMEIGEVRRVDASYATHIMARLPLPENGWQNELYKDMMGDFKEYVKSEAYAEKIAPMLAGIILDEELADKHTVYNTPTTAY